MHGNEPPTPNNILLLVNLGTPQAPTATAVRRYLAEFLHDRRVVQMTRWLWCPLLHFIILPLRGPKVARKYAQVWMQNGSPLAVHTRELAQALQTRLPQWRVLPAMRYGEPSLKKLLSELQNAGNTSVQVLPLYPQYSTTTTESVKDVVNTYAGVRCVSEDYSTHPQWVIAIAQSIEQWRAQNGSGEHLLFSFHGLPQRIADAGDPYPQRCEASAQAIAQQLGLSADQYTLAYQSRFGREAWLQPSTKHTLQKLAAKNIKTIDVVCPGFAVDCLETLEEIALRLVQDFAQSGGSLRYIPCLNATPAHVEALVALLDTTE